MSRQPTWDTACALQADMFREAASIGGLDIQLVYFRGLNECRASGWVAGSERLAELMSRIDCRGGHTQIGKVLSHARSEHARAEVQALVFVGDAMEEPIDDLVPGGGRTRAARRAGFHVPGGRRSGGGDRRIARSRGSRAAPIAASIAARRMSSANCCARSRPMPPAASRRSPNCRRSAPRRAQATGAAEIAMPALIFGVLVLVLVLWALNVISKADPEDRCARDASRPAASLALGFAAFLGLRGEIGVAIPLGAFGLGLLGWVPFGSAGFSAAHAEERRADLARALGLFSRWSSITTAARCAARILAGRQQGAALERLDVTTLVELLAEIRRGKPRATCGVS